MKKILTIAVISAAVLLASCKKEGKNDDENILTAAMILASNAGKCRVAMDSSTLSVPFIAASTTSQEVSFATINGISYGVVVAKNLSVGSKVVFTGNATAKLAINSSENGCNIYPTSSLGSYITQTSTNPASFTVVVAIESNIAFLVSGTGNVTVQIQ